MSSEVQIRNTILEPSTQIDESNWKPECSVLIAILGRSFKKLICESEIEIAEMCGYCTNKSLDM